MRIVKSNTQSYRWIDHLSAALYNTQLQHSTQMAETVKQEVLEIFSELLTRLWERLVGLIGETATVAVFRSALLETSRDYPLVKGIRIENTGVYLEDLKKDLESPEHTEVRPGLLSLTDNVMALLIDLTGGILLSKVEPIVEQYKQKLNQA